MIWILPKKLASLADLYVNDGFGVSHRAHASVEGVTHFLPSAAGFLLEKEIRFVGQAVENPLHPLCCYHWRCQGFRQDRRDRKSFWKKSIPC